MSLFFTHPSKNVAKPLQKTAHPATTLFSHAIQPLHSPQPQLQNLYKTIAKNSIPCTSTRAPPPLPLLQLLSPHATPSTPPNTRPTCPKTGPTWPKTGSRRPKTCQTWPKTAPRQAQDGSRQAQDGPTQAQRGPRQAENGSRQAQDGPRQARGGPRQLQGGPSVVRGCLYVLRVFCPPLMLRPEPPSSHSSDPSHVVA